MPALIEQHLLQARLDALGHVGQTAWQLRDGKLCIDLAFADFVHAFAFMTAVALRAQAMDHHPEWRNVFNRVSIALTTHSADGLTALDFELAEAVSTHARRTLAT